MQRIWIIGATGSGKTTLGKQLAQKLHNTAIDLDDLNWLPDWQCVSTEELVKAVEGATEAEQWIISGNYSQTQKYMTRADTLIWLDYSFSLVLWQLLKRTCRRMFKGELCCNGNRESLKMTLSRESIILWLFRTYRKRKKIGLATMVNPSLAHIQMHHFKSPRQTANWLQSL